MNGQAYIQDGPREKAAKKGIGALTTYELLQLLIGSGTKHAPVTKIARKVEKMLRHFDRTITYEQLSGIEGLGPARVTLLLAVFELAGRYPGSQNQRRLETSKDYHLQFLKKKPQRNQYCYLTLDGAGRLLRQTAVKWNNDSEILTRKVSADAVADNANSIQVGRYDSARLLVPSLADLSFARDLMVSSKVLGFTVGFMIFNDHDWHSVTKDVSHV